MNDNYLVLVAAAVSLVTGYFAGLRGARKRMEREAHLWWKNKKGR